MSPGPNSTYLRVRPQHLRPGDVVEHKEFAVAWNEKRHMITPLSMRLINRVDCLSGHVWLAENVATGEQQIIKLYGYYVTVYAGTAVEKARRGVGQLIERAYFWQYVPEGAE